MKTLNTLFVLAICVVGRVEAQDAVAARHEYIANENEYTKCMICHESARPPFDSGTRVTLTEATTWKNQDKHAKAYKSLYGETAQRMTRLLGYDVRKDARCVSCHTGAFEDPDDRSVVRAGGVGGCQMCHGPARDWENMHQERNWHTKTAEEKKALGLRDTRDPVAKAELCVSCHLGSPAEGKVVTHDMYAAGHPPLPGFEIETFTKVMPTHGKPLKDRPDIIQQLGLADEKLPQTKAMLAASVVSMRAAVQLLADASAPKENASVAWPELALFDCAACHHELRLPSARQARGYPGLPGRPAIRTWPLAMYSVIDPDAAKTLAPIHQALSRQPFGRPAAIQQAAHEALPQVDAALKKFKGERIDETSAVAWLKRICDAGANHTFDYDSARQLAWAFQVVFQELTSGPEAERPFDSTRQREIEDILNQLGRELSLGLVKPTAQENVDANLDAAGKFQVDRVREQFGKLKEALKAK
jgi:hypothetical protein